MYTLDGQDGTMDPAFDAHVGPLKFWALAWWEGWFPPEQLEEAFSQASCKLAEAKDSWWPRVTGPTTAVLATLNRIGWNLPSAREAIDDLGQSWNFQLDSPAALVIACKSSVRRWRLNRVAHALPGLVPTARDFAGNETRDTLVDCTAAVTTLVKGRMPMKLAPGTWERSWSGALFSAMVGGQWTQARKAAVPTWNIQDSRCQLCFGATGTIAHRFQCPALCPAEGWPAPSEEATTAQGILNETRMRFLREHAMLILRVPAQPIRENGTFTWIRHPDHNDPRLSDALWVFDGSLLLGKWVDFRTTGFGIVVIGKAGDLLAFGNGQPPSWCATDASAEA